MSALRRPGRCLGLVGGLGPGATVHYYRELIAAHERHGRSLRILIAHAEIDRVYAAVNAKDFDGLARYFAGMIADMAAGGAEFPPSLPPPLIFAHVNLPLYRGCP